MNARRVFAGIVIVLLAGGCVRRAVADAPRLPEREEPAAGRVASVVITEIDNGFVICPGPERLDPVKRYELVRRGAHYVSEHHAVPVSAVDALANLLESAPRSTPEEALLELGLTPEAWEQNRERVFRFVRDRHPELEQEIAGSALSDEASYQRVLALAVEELRSEERREGDAFGRTLRLELLGTGLTFEGWSDGLPVAPWRIRSAGDSFLTYSPQVARALAPLISGSEGHPPIFASVRGASLWDASALWAEILGEPAIARATASLSQQLERKLGRWTVESARLSSRGELTAMLRARSLSPEQTVTGITWKVPVSHGRVAATEAALEEVVARIDGLLERLHWLRAWRDAAPGRAVSLDLEGASAETTMGGLSFYDFQRAWTHAGLLGLPTHSVSLVREGIEPIPLVFGRSEARSLALKAYDAPASAWKEESSTPELVGAASPSSYVVLGAEGQLEARDVLASPAVARRGIGRW